MKINIKILSGGVKEETRDIPVDFTYDDLLGSMGINPEIVLVFRNGSPVPLDEKVTPDDVEILRVVSGG
ncbi:MAG: MoaD/ThiS family protein [Candidatus Methanoperedens sp.]|nr:MoaD/ThiS family protein [Candidatus Methanoperedens sp.]PKL54463.1 MAG: thiamine biosynthesis protein ThiS [Candidatus Methanoperedenaceae archaeon HGW-Methanoperedenaceae-1]